MEYLMNLAIKSIYSYRLNILESKMKRICFEAQV